MMIDATQSSQALLLAIAIEKSNATWFHNCAIRFLPYDTALSELLEELSREELSHRDELIAHYESTYGDLPEVETAPPESLRNYQNGLKDIQRHFFVVDEVMAHTILEKALEIERYTHHFYIELKDRVADVESAAVYGRLSEYEREHQQLFLKRLENDGDQGM